MRINPLPDVLQVGTLGAKANDATIQQLVISMKDELEKAKEQILNIL